MKKLLIVTVVLVFSLACSKDEDSTDIESLSGTSWKSQVITETPPYYYGAQYEHHIKFLGKETFQWSLINYPSGGEQIIEDGMYSLDENTVVLNYLPMFRIEKNKMIMLDDEKVVLTKQ